MCVGGGGEGRGMGVEPDGGVGLSPTKTVLPWLRKIRGKSSVHDMALPTKQDSYWWEKKGYNMLV